MHGSPVRTRPDLLRSRARPFFDIPNDNSWQAASDCDVPPHLVVIPSVARELAIERMRAWRTKLDN